MKNERDKKKIYQVFQENGLKVEIKCKHQCVKFLDVLLDLQAVTHKTYSKPNAPIQYVHRESNYPKHILDQNPISVEARLSK